MALEKFLYLTHDQTLTFSANTFSESSSKDLKSLFSGSIIPLSLIQVHTLKLPNHLTDEEQAIQVELRMYEEANLNAEEEYVIDYLRHELSSENSYLFEAFALSRTKAAEYFAHALKDVKAIDLCVPGFMIYESLYDTLPKENDLFIYLGDEEAFAAIYQDGHYIAHRSLETLTSMAVETGFTLSKLKEILHNRGLIEEEYPPEEFGKFILIQDRFARNIEKLVHTINHKRGLFGFSKIDHIYLDFEGALLPGLDKVFDAYSMHDLQITPIIRPTKGEQIHDLLCGEYLQRTIPSPSLNLSPFLRKVAWYRCESGKFLSTLAVSSAIAILVPLVLWWMIVSEESRNEELSATLAQTKQETSRLAAILQEKKTHIAEQEKSIKASKEEITLIQNAQETAELIDQMHLKRQQFLLDTTAELGRYRLGTLLMEQNSSKEMTLHVLADDRKRDDIAKMMSGLFARGYQNVQTHEISRDDGMYTSLIKVTR